MTVSELDVPYPVVDDNKQTQNLDRLKAWEVLLRGSLADMQDEIDALIAGTVVDATSTVKGKLKLTGDLGGTADSPTVPGLAGKVDTTDPRLSDARTPTAHAPSHKAGGTDQLRLHELAAPTGDVAMNSRKLTGLQQGSVAGDSAEYSQMIAGDVAAQMGLEVKSSVSAVSIGALPAHGRVGDVLTASANGFLAPSFGSLKFSWASGSAGTANGRFDEPWDVALDSSGNIFVLDRGNSRVQKFNSSGVYQSKFGSAGTGNGQFTNAAGIAIDSSNRIYVIDRNRIQRFTSAGVYSTTLVTWSDSAYEPTTTLAGLALHVDGSGNIYAAWRDRGDLGYPRPFDPFEYFVLKYNSGGTPQWGKGGVVGSGNGFFDTPAAIATDGSGNVFVADSGNNRVQKFNSSGTYQSKFGTAGTGDGEFLYPNGIEVDSNNDIWVSNYFNGRVQQFDSSGTFEAKYGGGGNGNGQFYGPRGIAVTSGGDLIVADSINNRIQRFTTFTLAASDTVLVRHEGDGTHVENNIYTVTNPGSAGSKWVLTLRADGVTGFLKPQSLVIARAENATQNRAFLLTTPGPITVWTDPLTWDRFEPGGPPTPHATNHAAGSVDPLPDRSVSPSMLDLDFKRAAPDSNTNINSSSWTAIDDLVLTLDAGLWLISYDLDTTFTSTDAFGFSIMNAANAVYGGLRYHVGHAALERLNVSFSGPIQLAAAVTLYVKGYRVSGSGTASIVAEVAASYGNTSFSAVRLG